MEITVRHIGDAQFEAQARGHHIICDQPLDNGGYDEGMTPPEFLLVSLGTCAGYYVAQYLSAHSLVCPELEIKVVAEKAKEPARLASFRIEIFAPSLEPRHEAGVLRAVHKCLIHNTLLHPPAIETVVHCAALQS
ncbi:MAG: OsmC family protein [Acidobacteriia bacterium]|nr:OsmC family protein [Terriglobia bacterium]